MQFGLFNLMGYRERGVSTSEILAQAAEQTVRAEEADFDTAWFAEHHFSNYCVCPSPLLMVAPLRRADPTHQAGYRGSCRAVIPPCKTACGDRHGRFLEQWAVGAWRG